MKERLLTLACALGVLALFLVLFVRSAGDLSRRALSRPTTEDRGGNGYYAGMRWLAGEGVRSLSLRERLDKLPRMPGLSARGNLLIVTLPAAVSYRSAEQRALEGWVRRGNTLLVLAALTDAPEWAVGGRPALDVSLLTGLELEPVAAMAGFESPEPATLVPNRPDAYFEGVSETVALSDHPWQSWRLKVPRDGFVLSLASRKETGEAVLWIRALGAGRILVSGVSSLFANRTLGVAGNARLLANIVSITAGQGAVLFDDAHQGLGDAYDAARFYRDPRLYMTIGVLAAVWLSWVLGSTRLRVAEAGRAPCEADLVRATGGLLARVVRSPSAAQRLLAHFFRRACRGRGSPDSPWERLEQDSRIARQDLLQLKEWDQAARAGRRVPLIRLHNLILRIERRMAG
jgi:hypothetical protein